MIQYKKFNIDPKHFCAIAICLFFVMTRYFMTDFFDNEGAYSIGPIKILNSSFLANNPFIERLIPFAFVYNSLASPFYYSFDFLTATLICRVLIWIFQIWALSKLTRTLGITWWGSILLFILWLNVEQTLVAGEWIIGCASAKPVSYGFIFLALNSFLRNELKWSGVFCGISIAFHALLGLWSAMALFLAIILTQYKSMEGKKVISFCIAAAVLSLPGLVPAITEVMGNTSNVNLSSTVLAAPSEVARLSVLMANPFHLDPEYFMTGLEFLKVALFFLLSMLMMNYFLPKEKARPLIVFIFFLCVFFILGLVARYAEWYRFLKYYPFRVADAFVPLSFWIGIVILFQNAINRLKKKGIFLFLFIPIVIGGSNYLIEFCEPKPNYDFTLKSLTTAMLRTEPRLTAYWVRERGKEWHAFLFAREFSDIEEMESWIKEHTPQDSVFITPPWNFDQYSFSLRTKRSEFISFKLPTVDASIFEWKERMEYLNGEQFRSVGWGILCELRENYSKLTEEKLMRIERKYGPDYILTTSKVHLNFELVHANNSYQLYKLENFQDNY